MNEDGSVDSTDITYMKRYLLRKIKDFPSENGKKAADINEDGSIDSTDLTILKRIILRTYK